MKTSDPAAETALTFEEWFDRKQYVHTARPIARRAWQAATKAERERIAEECDNRADFYARRNDRVAMAQWLSLGAWIRNPPRTPEDKP